MDNNKTVFVPAIDRALDVLEMVAKSRQCVNISEMVEKLGIPRTTVFRIVKQLVSRGYLSELDDKPGNYHLGYEIFTLASGMNFINDLREMSRSEMDKLAIESKQVAQLGVLRDYNVTYIDQAMPPNPVLLYTSLYSVLPLNISAAGKVLAAFAKPNVHDYLLKNIVFEKKTENTIVNLDDFVQELDKVRKQGYAEDDEEFSLGIGCLAVPVFDHNMNCVAAIGVTGGIGQYRGQQKEEILKLLLKSAAAVSAKLGMTKD